MPNRHENEGREAEGRESEKVPEGRRGGAALDAARSLPPRVFAFAGIAVWCFLVMVISLNLATTALHWLSIAAFGVLLPFFLVNFVNGIMREHEIPPLPPEDKEGELLAVLAERGELTPTLAAMKTSLTVGEASEMLEGLARKGYLEMRGEDGVLAYGLWERDFRASRNDGRNSERSVVAGASGFEGNTFDGDVSAELTESLSERELEVLTLLSSGKSNREIARDLFVAEGTIKTHTNNIYRKIGAKNRAEALAKARSLRLI